MKPRSGGPLISHALAGAAPRRIQANRLSGVAKSAVFRANVGILLIDADGLVLAGERSDHPGAWQLPQGGVDFGESAIDAWHRELVEETGLVADEVSVVAEHPDWLAYEWPEERRRKDGWIGQVQKWFVARIDPDAEPDPAKTDDEFMAFKWMRMVDLANQVHPMRQPIYRRLVEDFAALLA